MRTWASAFLASALLLAAAPAQQSVPTPAQDSTYNATVAPVRRSPPAAAHLLLSPGETVVALNVAAHAPIAAAIVAAAAGRYEVRLWDVAQNLSRTVWQAPAGTRLSALVWDPAAPTAVLYLLARTSSQSQLLKLAQANRGWAATTLFASLPDLRRLVISPRPFDGKLRLYFGQRKPDGSYRILSITAKGTRLYQLIGPKSTRIKINDPQIDGQPTSIPVPSALPVSFHPAGNRLIWEDSHGCFQSLVYGFKDWNGVRSVAGGRLCGGGWLAPTPNGLGLLAWHSGTSGVTLYLDHAQIARPQATADRFLLPPASVPDGRGIVGAVQMGARQALAYVPIQVPLADVVNAWMFATTPSDRRHLIRDAGLFRPFASTSPTNNDQLYSLYDSELYLCGGLNDEIPTRPYLVTTDLIWEVYGAAYHGLFTITERQQAIPAFWRFVAAARAALQREHPQSPWNTVFATIGALRHPPPHPTGEVARILQAPGGLMQQPQFLRPMDYSQLRPRLLHHRSRPAALLSRLPLPHPSGGAAPQFGRPRQFAPRGQTLGPRLDRRLRPFYCASTPTFGLGERRRSAPARLRRPPQPARQRLPPFLGIRQRSPRLHRLPPRLAPR
ncbi:MAG TPA: hypothetical protein VNF74_12350 [Terriglobales bacterium]|nr:hypothetical protein [Terriglobales bacterium]